MRAGRAGPREQALPLVCDSSHCLLPTALPQPLGPGSFQLMYVCTHVCYVLDEKLKNKYKKQIAHIPLLCIMIHIILAAKKIYFIVWLYRGLLHCIGYFKVAPIFLPLNC